MTAVAQTPDGGDGGPAKPRSAARRVPLLIGLVGFLIVAAVAYVALSGSGSSGGPDGEYSTDPARWVLPALDGTDLVRLSDFKGKPVVVNFFASWCVPCKEELPEFVRASRELAGEVAFVAVNSKELGASAGPALARSAGLAEAGITLARDVGGAGGSGLHDSYEVRSAMPVTAFYDAAGNLADVVPGQLNRDKLSTRLRELFGVTL